jgi:hypothetical protein
MLKLRDYVFNVNMISMVNISSAVTVTYEISASLKDHHTGRKAFIMSFNIKGSVSDV